VVLVFLAAGTMHARTVDIGGARVETRMAGKVECVPLSAVAAALNGKYWRVDDRFVMVLPGDSVRPGREYVLRADSTCALCDSRRVTLPAAPVLDSSRLYLPVVALPDLFPSTSVPDLRTMEAVRQGDTLVFTFRGQCRPGEKFVGFGDSRSSLEYRLVIGARRDSGLAEQVALLSLTPPGMLKGVTLDSGPGASLSFSFRQPTAERLAVLPDRVELRAWPRPERAIKRVVLDPGHGGEDPGALGRRGTREKVVVMDVARRLKKKLEKQGFEVILARDTDKFVSLAERTELGTVHGGTVPRGNGHKADLFVSIHANSAPNRAACGLETYFLSEAKTDWERAVAARENAAFETGDSSAALNVGGDVGLILADLAQNEFLVESSELAAQIQEATVPCARIKDRGVRQANFYVLRNNFMPAVLVECGFLSNKSEEKLLRQLEHRERLAEGISRGIVEFTKLYSPKANGSPSGGQDSKIPKSRS
jgi:N-acetylmuramoyl-L-alanine amidase